MTATSSAVAPLKSRRALPVILLAIFLDLVSYSILIPVVPQLLANPNSPYYLLPASVPVSYGYIILGFLIALFPIIQFFSTPILGELSDMHGRRKILLLSLFGTSLSLLVFGLGVVFRNLTLLFVSRAVGGLVGGNISVAQAAIADITRPRERLKYFGLMGAAYGVGLIIGPVMGGLLSDASFVSWFSAATPFWFATALSLINTSLVFIFMAETRPEFGEGPLSFTAALSNIVRAYGLKRLRSLLAVNFFYQVGLTFLATFFSVFLIERFSFSQVEIGYYIGYVGVIVAVTQGLILPLIAKWLDSVMILNILLVAASAAVFAFYFPVTVAGLLIVGALVGLSNGLAMATLPALISERTSPKAQGEVLGINASVQALAQAVPPILAGFLAAKIAPVAPVYISASVIFVAWLLFVTLVRREE